MARSAPVEPQRTHELQYHVPRPLTDDDALSVAIVEAVAAITGEDPTTVDVRLHEHFDPTALDAFYASARPESDAEWTLNVTIDEFEVTIRSTGVIAITDR